MPKIYEMPQHLRDLIAAGEVVERPGSVVKELVENSIDAGAESVTVEIKNGGMAFIRVTDDGCGIAREDTETAFLRHATSKLRDERGLEAIGTLGFRGEALAAVASVSRVELVTRERGAEEGTRLLLEAGTKQALEPAGCPEGTVITVRDLFFNTPARLKFIKNDRAEGANVTAAVTRLALSHPEVAFRYIRDGKEELRTPGDGRLESAIYCTLGRDLAKALLPARSVSEGIRVTGYVSTPAEARGNRNNQFFFLNGRFIRSRTLQSSLEQAYKNSLFTGRFPVCVLMLETGLSQVDVNVHPTKMEVRFSDERAVAAAVYWAAMSALEKESAPAALELPAELLRNSSQTASGKATSVAPAPEKTAAKAQPREGFFRTVSAEEYRGGGAGHAPRREQVTLRDIAPSSGGVQITIPLPKSPPDRAAGPWRAATTPRSVEAVEPVREPPPARERPSPVPEKTDAPTPEAATPTPEAATPTPEEDFRYIGEALCTYLVVERGGSLFLIDKHAAHERIHFDRLKAEGYKPSAQLLLTPVVAEVGETAAETLLENEALLEEFGFAVSDLGGGAVALRQIPQDIELGDPRALLEELAEKLSAGGRRDLDAMRDEVLHTVACKAAIKAGRRSEPAEVQGLIARVLSGEVRYCPHGRPVMLELTRAQLDRSFKRA